MARIARKLEDAALADVLLQAVREGALGLADACRYMRARDGLTQAEFAARVGVATKVVKELETGEGNPTLASLERIASSLGLRVAFIQPRATVHVGGVEQHLRRQAKARQAELNAVKQRKVSLKKRHAVNALQGDDFTIELPKLS